MKRAFETLPSALHSEQLKPLGFHKSGHTISRALPGYHERFNFQGSAWNEAGIGWRFYINVGVEFTDLPPEPLWWYFPHAHWAGRAEQLVPSAPRQWECSEAFDLAALKNALRQVILEASRALSVQHGTLRAAYLQRAAQSKPVPGA